MIDIQGSTVMLRRRGIMPWLDIDWQIREGVQNRTVSCAGFRCKVGADGAHTAIRLKETPRSDSALRNSFLKYI
jgi:hypothetical protein